VNDYTTAAMSGIWSQQNALDLWRSVELEVLRAQVALGHIPDHWLAEAENTPTPLVEEWAAATLRSGHEVVGFLESWGVEHAHIGLTSSDITDTALGLRMRDATTLLVDSFGDLMVLLDRLAFDHAETPRLGRTHGQAAASSTYGHLFAYWARGAERCVEALWGARAGVAICKISGPVGTYLHVSQDVERSAAAALGLTPTAVSTQIYMRDGLAYWAGVVGVAASFVEAVALELRLLAHEALGEAADVGGSSSSAMAHKLNPNRLERVCGLARVVRSGYEPIAAGVAQWHDRDMAHSSVERTYLPLMSGNLHYAVESVTEILLSLHIDEHRTQKAIHANRGEITTHSIQTALQLAGYSHLEAQRHTREIWVTGHAAEPWDQLVALGADHYYSSPKPTTPNPEEIRWTR